VDSLETVGGDNRNRALRPQALARLLAVGALLCTVLAPASAASAATRHTAAKPGGKPPNVKPAEVRLTPRLISTPGATVVAPPVGLSIEYSVMALALGSEACPPPALAAELEKLGSPPIELGGVTQDWTAPSGALPNPPTSWQTATAYPLPASFWAQLHCLLTATKDPLTVGLNLRTGSLEWAQQMAKAASETATNGLSFSLGNEPDLYGLPNYASLAKPLQGEELAAANLYLKLAEYLRPAIGNAQLVGPEIARPADWRLQLQRVIGQLHVQTVGVHAYPLTDCRGGRGATLDALLSAKVADEPSRLAWVAGLARAAGLPTIISEANSASCGGIPGLSDTPAAAVWAVRFVIDALKSGFEQVRFHSAGDPYDPFIVSGRAVVTRPIESALVALNRWLPVGATFRSVSRVGSLVATAIGEPPAPATGAPAAGIPASGSTTAKLVLILDNEVAQAQTVVVHAAGNVHVSILSAAFPGLASFTRAATAGVVRLSVARHSLIALSPSV